MNCVVLTGRWTKDVELRYSQGQNATAYATGTLAVDREGAKDGQQQADFPRVVIVGKQAENIAQYRGKKGDAVEIVNGRIQTRKFDKNGQTHYVTEVTVNFAFGGRANFGPQSKNSGQQNQQKQQQQQPNRQYNGGQGQHNGVQSPQQQWNGGGNPNNGNGFNQGGNGNNGNFGNGGGFPGGEEDVPF